MNNLKEFKKIKEDIENIDLSRGSYKKIYEKMFYICSSYMEEFEHLFSQFVTAEGAEEIIKNTLDKEGLAGLYYLLQDIDLYDTTDNEFTLIKINGSGHFELACESQLKWLKEEIIKILNNMIEHEQAEEKQYIKGMIKDLDDLCKRLQVDYVDGIPFEQYEEDRLIVNNTIDILEEFIEE